MPRLPALNFPAAHSGVVLVGPDGVGKTTLAEEICERFADKAAVRVVGTASQSSVPFGAFGPLVDIAEVGKPAALIRSALESLLAKADGAPVVVDDAHLLDPLSATLVYQLARTAADRLIVTVRPDSVLPEAIPALWNDGLLARIDVKPFGPDEAIAALADAAPDIEGVELYRRSGGNPLYLRLLAERTVAAGRVVEPTLVELLDMFLSDLAPSVRDALGYLSAYEPLSPADLGALVGGDVISDGETVGALRVIGGAVYAGHPTFTARTVVNTDPTQARGLRSAIAERLAAHPQQHLCERLGRAVLALDSNNPDDIETVVTAAQGALRLGDLRLSERLAAAAVNRSDRFDARLALANALAYQGRGREAESVMAAVDLDTLTEDQVMAWALPRAANQFFMLSEPERATIFLNNTKNRIGTPSSRITLEALSATFAMNAGNVARAMDVAAEVLASPDAHDMAVAWAASSAALWGPNIRGSCDSPSVWPRRQTC